MYGWRPLSVVTQPARIAMNPSGQAEARECADTSASSNSRLRHQSSAPSETEQDQQQADAHHDAERKEHDRHRRPVLAGKVLQRRHAPVRVDA